MDVTSYLLGKNASGGGGSKDNYNILAEVPEGTINGPMTSLIKKIGTFDTNQLQNMNSMFSSFKNLETVELLDTKNVTTFSRMFYNCAKLKDVPQFDTSKATNFANMFTNVDNNLTDESLNNVLGMCANAVSYTGTKTLATLGLNSYNAPVARLQAQPNYQAFLDAGWTIGY